MTIIIDYSSYIRPWLVNFLRFEIENLNKITAYCRKSIVFDFFSFFLSLSFSIFFCFLFLIFVYFIIFWIVSCGIAKSQIIRFHEGRLADAAQICIADTAASTYAWTRLFWFSLLNNDRFFVNGLLSYARRRLNFCVEFSWHSEIAPRVSCIIVEFKVLQWIVML